MKTLSADPLVSIIVNTVDRPEDLKRCLEAVFKQSYRHFEVVIINNGSGQETQRYLRELSARALVAESHEYPSIKVIEDKTKKLSYLFNLGWKSASPQAEIFAFAADDTQPASGWLAAIVNYLKAHPEAAAVSGPTLATTQPPGEMFALYDLAKKSLGGRIGLRLYEYFVMEDKTFAPGYWPQSGAFTMGAGIPQPAIREPLEIDLLTSGNMGITREAMTSVGGFDENFLFNHADGDLFIRLKRFGWKLIFHPKVSVLHHMRLGPTRYPQIMGRDTAFYYLKDVRPRSVRGWIGAAINLSVFLCYWIFKAFQLNDARQLRGISGFLRGTFDFFAAGTAERSELVKTLAVAGGFVALFAQALRHLPFDVMLSYGDAVPFPISAAQALLNFFSVWDYRSPGIYMPQIPVLSSLTFFEGVLIVFLGGHSVWAQALFHWLPLPLTFLSVYLVLGRFSFSRPAKFAAGFIYSANLVYIGEILGGFEGNLYIQAIFPWLLLCLYDFYRYPAFGFRIVLKFSLLLSFAYLLSDHVFLFLFPFALIFSLRMLSARRFRAAALFWVGAAFFVFLLTFFHTYYYIKLASPFVFGNLRGDVVAFLTRNVDDTYNYLTLGKALRVGGSYYQGLYQGSDFWSRLGFLLPLLAFSWFLFPRNRQGYRFWSGLLFSLLSLLTVVFLVLAREKLTFLFQSFPVLFRFRNPSRPWLFLSLNYAFLSALTLDGILIWVNSLKDRWRTAGRIFSAVLLLLLAVGSSYYFKPFFSGDFMMKENRGDGFWISERYYQISEWLAIQRRGEPPFRVLWLPWNHEEAEAKLYWLDPLAYAVPINYGAYTQSAYLSQLKVAYQNLAEEKLEGMAESLAEAGVRYVILNVQSGEKDKALYRYDYQTPWLLGSAGEWKRIVNQIGGLEPQADLFGFKIYLNRQYRPERVNGEKAGWPPSDIEQKRKEKYGVIGLSFLAWSAVLGFLLFTRSPSESGWDKFRWTKNGAAAL